MNADPALVEGGPAHAQALAAIHAAAFPPAERWTAAAFETQLRLPGVFAIIDAEGGFVLARVAADEAEILTLAVAPALRRQRRATALLRRASRHAAALGARALFLEAAASNAGALGLYASLGFAEVGRRRDYYGPGEAAIVLRSAVSSCAAPDG